MERRHFIKTGFFNLLEIKKNKKKKIMSIVSEILDNN